MKSRPRSRRRLAVLAVLAAAGVTAIAVVAGTASAAGTGVCTSAVNVREEPSTTAPIVGVCERGHSTRVGEARNGFVKLSEFDGWADSRYVSTGSQGDSAPNTTRDDEGSLGSPRTGSPDDSTQGTSPDRSTSPRQSTSPDRDALPRESSSPQQSSSPDESTSPSTGTGTGTGSGSS